MLSRKTKTISIISAAAIAIGTTVPAFAIDVPEPGAQNGSGATTLKLLTDTSEYGGTEITTGDYANPDSNGDGLGDNLAFTVPSALNFVVKASGDLMCPSAAATYIKNETAYGIHVSSVEVGSETGWNLVADASASGVTAANAVSMNVGPAMDSTEKISLASYTSKTSLANGSTKWGMSAKKNGGAASVYVSTDTQLAYPPPLYWGKLSMTNQRVTMNSFEDYITTPYAYASDGSLFCFGFESASVDLSNFKYYVSQSAVGFDIAYSNTENVFPPRAWRIRPDGSVVGYTTAGPYSSYNRTYDSKTSLGGRTTLLANLNPTFDLPMSGVQNVNSETANALWTAQYGSSELYETDEVKNGEDRLHLSFDGKAKNLTATLSSATDFATIHWYLASGGEGSQYVEPPALPTTSTFSSTSLEDLHAIGEYVVGAGKTNSEYIALAKGLVGQTIDVPLNEGKGTMTVRLASVDNTRGLTFEAVDILTKDLMNYSATNAGGWAESDLQKSMNQSSYTDKNGNPVSDTVYAMYFSNVDWKDFVREVTNTSYNYGGTTTESSDCYWVPSANNVFGAGWMNKPEWGTLYDGGFSDNEAQFDYYAALMLDSTNSNGNAILIKKYQNSASRWWFRSSGPNDGINFMNITVDGRFVSYYPNENTGVSPCFCL